LVNCYKCDICGTVDEFDNNAAIVSKGEKLHDLCPNCLPEVQGFIRDKSESSSQKVPNPDNIPIEEAIEILKMNHYVVYPVVEHRQKKKGIKAKL